MTSLTSDITVNARAIIFDMDGVITDTMPYHYQAWDIAFREITKHTVTREDIYLREGSKGSMALDEIFDQHGWPHDSLLIQRLLKRKEKIFSQIARFDFINGALDFLARVHARGFQLGLVTGTSREELEKMLPPNICNYFSVIVTGTDVVRGKPDPEPYRTALSQFKIAPDDAVVIENAPMGIRSAKQAQICCLALETSLSREYLGEADYIFKSFADLEQHVTLLKPEELP